MQITMTFDVGDGGFKRFAELATAFAEKGDVRKELRGSSWSNVFVERSFFEDATNVLLDAAVRRIGRESEEIVNFIDYLISSRQYPHSKSDTFIREVVDYLSTGGYSTQDLVAALERLSPVEAGMSIFAKPPSWLGELLDAVKQYDAKNRTKYWPIVAFVTCHQVYDGLTFNSPVLEDDIAGLTIKLETPNTQIAIHLPAGAKPLPLTFAAEPVEEMVAKESDLSLVRYTVDCYSVGPSIFGLPLRHTVRTSRRVGGHNAFAQVIEKAQNYEQKQGQEAAQ